MVRKKTFTKQQVQNAAVELVRDRGIDALTARSLAAAMGCSTMPIYSAVGSLEALEWAVITEAVKRLHLAQRHPHTEDPLVNLAIGYVAFARDEPQLFRALFVDRHSQLDEQQWKDQSRAALREALGEDIDIDAVVSPGDPSSMDDLTIKSWIFTHGLASLVGNGVLHDVPDERIAQLVLEAGGSFWMWANQASSDED